MKASEKSPKAPAKASVSTLYTAVLDQVKSRLAQNKLTQGDIGKALGIKQSAVSYLLKGKTKLTMEQFLVLAALVGEKPHALLAEADSGLAKIEALPRAMEDAMLKSPLHLLLYAAANRPIKAAAFTSATYNEKLVTEAFLDLVRGGLLKREGKEEFVQKDSSITYMPATSEGALRRFNSLLEVHRHCQQIWMRNFEAKEFRSRRFNFLHVSYFTASQIREVKEHLWRAYEKIRQFEKENSASGYQAYGEEYTLWQAHMMLMTPFQEK